MASTNSRALTISVDNCRRYSDVSVGGGGARLHAASVGSRGFLPYKSSKGDAPVEICLETR